MPSPEFGYAQAGHQQVWHVYEGTWKGPREWGLVAESPNLSLCGRKVSRQLVGQPGPRNARCPKCEDARTGLADEPYTMDPAERWRAVDELGRYVIWLEYHGARRAAARLREAMAMLGHDRVRS